MSKTNIGYNGKVTVRYEKNGRSYTEVLHNEGKPALFETLATLLSNGGFPYGSPSYISLYKKSSGGVETSLLNQEILPLITKPSPKKGADGKWCSAVTARIRNADLNSTTIGDGDTVLLYLRTNSSENTRLASVTIAESMLPSSQGTSTVIEWDLFFENAPTTTTT